nr:acyltransferase family protein [uncultured Alistipes sp.]
MKALENAVCRLMIPSLIFSVIVFIPKTVFHSEDLNIMSFVTHVFGGISYWFTSALFVAQIVLLTLVVTLQRKDIWTYLLCSVFLFAIGWYLNCIRTDNNAEAFLPWFWKTGIEYTLFMALGGVYMKYEDRIHARRKVILTLSAVVYIVATIMAFRGVGFQLMGLGGRCDLPGAIWIASGIALIIALCRYIEHNRFLSFIGQNSIVFYFFSGVFPAFIGMVARRIFSDGNYIVTITVAALSIALAWIATMIINRYLPFLIDIRNIKRG